MAATEAAVTSVVIVEGVVGEEEATLVVGEEVDSEETEEEEEEEEEVVAVDSEVTEEVVVVADFEATEEAADFEAIEAEAEADFEVEGEAFPVAQCLMKFLRKMKLRVAYCYGLLKIPLETPGLLIRRRQRLKMLYIQSRRRHSTLAA